ncbi:MAG: 2-deoxyglucose-6-phosphate phosphatase [Planctomycetes bacterium ADurb.Bin126]|nr:MAG: 2-deoxyglucose-6-phosphate phosphatase [Planctomycetes bacterium ADurb.Bin126]HQL74980.1 HAD family phosphatase [Phycisphaerae bacterium]
MTDYGVIFDMDGVLVDSYEAHYQSWLRMARSRGWEMTREQFKATFGRVSRDIIQRLWGDQIQPEEIPDLDDRKEVEYRTILREHFPEMDGASDLVLALHGAGFRLAIGSSGPRPNVETVIDRLPHEAGKCFDAYVHAMDVTHGKPHPEVFLKAAGKLRLPPRRCAVVEDSLMGLEAARRAEMVAIGLTGTAAREQLADLAHLVVDSLRELTPDGIRGLIDRPGR